MADMHVQTSGALCVENTSQSDTTLSYILERLKTCNAMTIRASLGQSLLTLPLENQDSNNFAESPQVTESYYVKSRLSRG
jgi:hypothetical protein